MASSSYLVDLTRLPENVKSILTALKRLGYVGEHDGVDNTTCFVANSHVVFSFMRSCTEEEAGVIFQLMETSSAQLDIDMQVLQTAFITQASICNQKRKDAENQIKGLRKTGNHVPLLRELTRKSPNWRYEWPEDNVVALYRTQEPRMTLPELTQALNYVRDPEWPWSNSGKQVWRVTHSKGFVHTLVKNYIQPYKNDQVLGMKLAVTRLVNLPTLQKLHSDIHNEFALVGYNQSQIIQRLCQYNDYAVHRTVHVKTMLQAIRQTAYSVYPNDRDPCEYIAFRNQHAIWYPLAGEAKSIAEYKTASALAENSFDYPLRETQALLRGRLGELQLPGGCVADGEKLFEIAKKYGTDRVVHVKCEVLPTEKHLDVESETYVYTPKLPRTFATGLGCVRGAMGALLASYEEGYKSYNSGLLYNRAKRIRSISGEQFTSEYLIANMKFMLGHSFTLSDLLRSKHMVPDRKRMEMTVTRNTRVALWGLIRDSCRHASSKDIVLSLMAWDCGDQSCKWSHNTPGAELTNGALLSGHPFTSRLDDFDNQYHMVSALQTFFQEAEMYISVGSDDGWVAWQSTLEHDDVAQSLIHYGDESGAIWTDLEKALVVVLRTSQYQDFASLKDVRTIDGYTFNAFGCHQVFTFKGQTLRWVKIFGMVPVYFYDDDDILQYAIPVYDMRKILVSSYTPHSQPKGIDSLAWKLSRISGINDIIGVFYPVHEALKQGFDSTSGDTTVTLIKTDEHSDFIPACICGLRLPHEVLALWCPSHPLAGSDKGKEQQADVIESWDYFDNKDMYDLDWAAALAEGEAINQDIHTPIVPNKNAVPSLKQRTLEVANNFVEAHRLMLDRLTQPQGRDLLMCNERELAGKLKLSVTKPGLLQDLCKLTLGKAQIIQLNRVAEPTEESGHFTTEFKRGSRSYSVTVFEDIPNKNTVMFWFLSQSVNNLIGYPNVKVEVILASGPNKQNKDNPARRQRKRTQKGKQGFRRPNTYVAPIRMKINPRDKRRLHFEYANHEWEQEYEEEYEQEELEMMNELIAGRLQDDEDYRNILERHTKGSIDERLYVVDRRKGYDGYY